MIQDSEREHSILQSVTLMLDVYQFCHGVDRCVKNGTGSYQASLYIKRGKIVFKMDEEDADVVIAATCLMLSCSAQVARTVLLCPRNTRTHQEMR